MVRFGNISIYHVRFFGDKGRRAWVYSHCLIPFTDKNDFDALAKNASFTVSFNFFKLNIVVLILW